MLSNLYLIASYGCTLLIKENVHFFLNDMKIKCVISCIASFKLCSDVFLK